MAIYQSLKNLIKGAVLVSTLVAITVYASYKNHDFIENEVAPKVKTGIEKVIELDKYLEFQSPESVKKLNEYQRKKLYDPTLGKESRTTYKKK